MTKKNARKTAARARQEKTGQRYQSALRAEGSRIGHRDRKPENMTKEERDNIVAQAIQEMGPEEFWRRVQDARLVNETLKENVEPEKLMEYWKPLPEAKRIINSKELRMGVTDDHPEKPLLTWTSLARTKDCPGFSEWWHSLPESSRYDHAQHENLCDFTWQAPRAQGYPNGGNQTVHCTMPKGHVGGPDQNTLRHTHSGPDGSAIFDVPLVPGTDTMPAGPTGLVRIVVEEKHPTAGISQHNRHTITLTKVGNDEAMFEAIGARVKEERPSWTGWCFVLAEPV